jgi:hypothetical protein
MKTPRTLLSAVALLICTSATRAEVPQLFRERSFNAAILAEAVNHFIALGEEAAVRELADLAPGFEQGDFKNGFTHAERVGWVCRILFQPKGDKPLRLPGYGGLSMPHLTMPLARWPLYPVAASGDSFFVLSEGYSFRGIPENPINYLVYCRAKGVFRKQPVLVPMHAQAAKDVLALQQSSAWKAIKWKDSGPGTSYTISEEHIWPFIQAQADTIK